MNRVISRKELEMLRKKFRKGARVRLVKMDDPYVSMPPGQMGTVDSVDDIGTVHVIWDDGRRLGAAYGEDEIELLRDGSGICTDEDYAEIFGAWQEVMDPEGNLICRSVPARGVFGCDGNLLDTVLLAKNRKTSRCEVFASEEDMYNAWVSDWLIEESACAECFSPEYVRNLFEGSLDEKICRKLSELYAGEK